MSFSCCSFGENVFVLQVRHGTVQSAAGSVRSRLSFLRDRGFPIGAVPAWCLYNTEQRRRGLLEKTRIFLFWAVNSSRLESWIHNFGSCPFVFYSLALSSASTRICAQKKTERSGHEKQDQTFRIHRRPGFLCLIQTEDISHELRDVRYLQILSSFSCDWFQRPRLQDPPQQIGTDLSCSTVTEKLVPVMDCWAASQLSLIFWATSSFMNVERIAASIERRRRWAKATLQSASDTQALVQTVTFNCLFSANTSLRTVTETLRQKAGYSTCCYPLMNNNKTGDVKKSEYLHGNKIMALWTECSGMKVFSGSFACILHVKKDFNRFLPCGTSFHWHSTFGH